MSGMMTNLQKNDMTISDNVLYMVIGVGMHCTMSALDFCTCQQPEHLHASTLGDFLTNFAELKKIPNSASSDKDVL